MYLEGIYVFSDSKKVIIVFIKVFFAHTLVAVYSGLLNLNIVLCTRYTSWLLFWGKQLRSMAFLWWCNQVDFVGGCGTSLDGLRLHCWYWNYWSFLFAWRCRAYLNGCVLCIVEHGRSYYIYVVSVLAFDDACFALGMVLVCGADTHLSIIIICQLLIWWVLHIWLVNIFFLVSVVNCILVHLRLATS